MFHNNCYGILVIIKSKTTAIDRTNLNVSLSLAEEILAPRKMQLPCWRQLF